MAKSRKHSEQIFRKKDTLLLLEKEHKATFDELRCVRHPMINVPLKILVDDYRLICTAFRNGKVEVLYDILPFMGVANDPETENHCALSTPLHYSVMIRKADYISCLMMSNASIYSRNQNGDMPLHLSAKISLSLTDEFFNIIYNIMGVKNLANELDNHGLSFFMIACMCNQEGFVLHFLKNGVNVNSQISLDSDYWPGYTALHFAMENKHFKISQLLLTHNANANITNKDGKTAQELFTIDKKKMQDGLSEFHTACKNNVKDILKFLQAGVNVNMCASEMSKYPGYTALHFIAENNNLISARTLLSKGSNLTIKNKDQMTPLHLACKYYSKEMINLMLLNHENKIENPVNKDNLSHFHIMCIANNKLLVEKFIEKNVDINLALNLDSNFYPGYTPLHFAVDNESTNVIKVLMKHQVDLTIKDKEGFTALHLAYYIKNTEIIDLLLGNVNKTVNPVDKNGISHVHIACARGDLAIVEEFIAGGVDMNNFKKCFPTPLHIACEYRNINIIKRLLGLKVDVDAQDNLGRTALHIACKQNEDVFCQILQDIIWPGLRRKKFSGQGSVDYLTELFGKFNDSKNITIDNTQIDIVKLLLNGKCNVNLKDKCGKTPLFYTYQAPHFLIKKYYFESDDPRNFGEENLDLFITGMYSFYESQLVSRVLRMCHDLRREIIKILIGNNADVTISDNSRQNLLHLMAKTYEDVPDEELKLGEIYLKRGTNVNEVSIIGKTPLMIACKNYNPHFVKLFINYNADVNIVEKPTLSSPLHIACYYKNVEALDHLITNNANIFLKDRKKRTALHVACLLPKFKTDTYLTSSFNSLDSVASYLIEAGIDINCQDEQGYTALHYSCYSQQNNSPILMFPTFELLLSGANFNLKNKNGATVFDSIMSADDNEDYLSECDDLLELVEFTEKIRILGLKVDDSIERKKKVMFQFHSGVRRKMEKMKKKNFEKKCKDEIKRMKETVLSNYISLHDLIRMHPNDLVGLIGNADLQNIIKSDKFHTRFNYYGFLVKSQYKKGCMKKALWDKAKEVLGSLTKMRIPDLCSEQLFKFLSNEDLDHFITTVSFTPSLKIDDQLLQCFREMNLS